jgi:hypothetical protein
MPAGDGWAGPTRTTHYPQGIGVLDWESVVTLTEITLSVWLGPGLGGVSKLGGAAGPAAEAESSGKYMDMQSGEWICMDALMDNSMDNAEIWWVDIYVYDKWISY